MEQPEKKIQDHLLSAKDELKSAAEGALGKAKSDINEKIEEAKDKVNEAVGHTAAKISDIADQVHNEVTKDDSAKK